MKDREKERSEWKGKEKKPRRKRRRKNPFGEEFIHLPFPHIQV